MKKHFVCELYFIIEENTHDVNIYPKQNHHLA